MKHEFQHEVYVVLDVGEPLAECILDLRKQFDERLAGLPVEIGVAGSSGLGTLVNAQDCEEVFDRLTELAIGINPFALSFKSLAKFPGTKWYYYEPANPEPFHRVHRLLRDSEIRFGESPYPYTAHCSVADLKGRPPSDESKLIGMPLPIQTCLMDRMSVYSLKQDWSCDLLFRTPLGT